MNVILPEVHKADFENLFNEENPDGFKNISLKICEDSNDYKSAKLKNWQYTVECYSLLSSLIESTDKNISDVCKKYGVKRFDIEVVNTYEYFWERIELKNGKYLYSANDYLEENCEEYELPCREEKIAE